MKKTIRTAPAILTDDISTLESLVRQAEEFTNFAQFDVMDGKFVPSMSVDCVAIASVKPSLTWEVHLMVEDPAGCLEDFRNAGAHKVVFHYEAPVDTAGTIEKIKKLGLQAGLAVNPSTTIEEIAPHVPAVDSVLFMSVNPGYYGAAFIPEVLEKVSDFRARYPDVEIGLDGGVNEKTIPEIVKSGVDTIYIGSAVFRQPDPGEAFRRLTALANA